MAAPAPIFHNPILRGFNPDPTICVVRNCDDRDGTGEGGKVQYFLSTSTFEYFPGCAIYHSTDLLNWKLIGHALTRRSQIEMRTVEPGAGSWASTLRYREKEKRWYLANGLFQRYRPESDERIFPRGFYVWTSNIWDSNAWSDPIYFDNPGFDQDLFWDDTHTPPKVYLSTTTRVPERDRPSPPTQKDFAIHISEIDLATGRTLAPPAVIRRSPHGIAEGSHVFARGGAHYLLTAEGGTEAGHQEWVFRSRAGPLGPWEEMPGGRPLWYNGPGEEVQRTGHVDVFEDGEGRWWGVFLGVRPVRRPGAAGEEFLEPQMGRETFLVKVDWVDDWPVFNEGRNITLDTRGRGGMGRGGGAEVKQLLAGPGDVKWKADLTRPELELGWYQKNTPLKQCYTLTERSGHLRIYGNCYDLTWPETPALLLRKQTSYSETFRATLDFRPSRPGYEAGVTLWWSQYAHATIGVACRPDLPPEYGGVSTQRTLVVRTPTGRPGIMRLSAPLLRTGEEGQEKGSPAEIGEGPVRLEIRARPTEYVLSFASGEVTRQVTVPASDLTVYPPVGGAFCGVMFGIYSFCKGEPVLDPADFSDISIQEDSSEL